MVWVNIDKPTKRYVVHSTSSCQYVNRKAETSYKGINELKRDGGWVAFDSKGNALSRHGRQFGDYELIEHC